MVAGIRLPLPLPTALEAKDIFLLYPRNREKKNAGLQNFLPPLTVLSRCAGTAVAAHPPLPLLLHGVKRSRGKDYLGRRRIGSL